MGNIVTGSGSGEPSHPSVLSHEGVHSEKDRLSTRSLNTSSMNRHSAPTLLRNVHDGRAADGNADALVLPVARVENV